MHCASVNDVTVWVAEMKTIIYMVLLSLLSTSVSAVYLTPTQNAGRGNIPGGYGNTPPPAGDPSLNFPMVFQTDDGGWVNDITLPGIAPDAAEITINARASYSSVLDLTNTDVGAQSISMNRGDTFVFQYDASARRWKIRVSEYSPNNVGSTIPDITSKRIVRYLMQDGDWSANVILPKANNGDVVIVRSTATYSSKVSPPSGVSGEAVDLYSGDIYTFVFQADLNRWNSVKARYLPNPVVQRINDNYNQIKNDCLEYGTRARRGHYYCSGNTIRGTADGDYNPWERPATGLTSYSWLRKDMGTIRLYRPVGFILRTPLYGAIHGLPAVSVGWTCLYPFDGWTASAKECDGITPEMASKAGFTYTAEPAPRSPTANSQYAFGACDKMGITRKEQWLSFFKAGNNAPWNQCSWNVESQTSWNAMIDIHQADIVPYSQVDPQSGIDSSWYKPAHNELKLNNAATSSQLNASAIEAIYFDVKVQPSPLEAARIFQRKLRQAGHSVPIVQLDFSVPPVERFSFSQADQSEAYDSSQCAHYIDSVAWIERYDPGTNKNEWSLSVVPTECGRNIQSDQTNRAYDELVSRFRNDGQWKNNDGGGMRRQLICHLAIARTKTTWNLEPFRPDVSHEVAINNGCNPV